MSDAPAGLVLAAGAGTRFGGTKQLADLRGRPLLTYALEAMTHALDRVVVVLGHEAELIRARVDFGRAEVVVAQDWASGQAASLRRGIEAVADADAVVVTLGDQPFMTSEVIRAALAQLDGHDAVRAMYDGKPGHPVVFGRAVMAAVRTVEGDVGARDLLARFRVNQWEAGHLASATDVDTEEELSGICGGSVPPLLGGVLTGTDLTLDEAARRLADGDEPLPELTPIQQKLVEAHAIRSFPSP